MKYFDIPNTCTIDFFIKSINRARKVNKDQWYAFNGVVNGKTIKIKGFDTWLQIFEINGLDNGNCVDQSVKRFNEFLTDTLNHHFKN